MIPDHELMERRTPLTRSSRSPWSTVRRVFLSITVASLACVAPIAAAQAGTAPTHLGGSVIDASSGSPVSGALVSLIAADGELRRSVLTRGNGRFSFALPSPGEWSLRVARIGYEESASDPVAVGEGEVADVTLRITAAPFVLDALEVQGQGQVGQCQRLDAEDGSLLVRLWQEARSALLVMAWAEAEQRYVFDMVRWNRVTDLVSNLVIEEEDAGRSRSFQPFETAPVEELLRDGWIRAADEDDTYDYYGLDAATLLSDAFQQNHCFEIREHPEVETRVGLAFSPERESEERAGIRGVLWLDRETAALEELDFHYTFHPHSPPIPPEITPLFNGVVEFRLLPDGGWIADRWSLRMPQYQVLAPSDARSIGQTMVGFQGDFREAIEDQPRWWQDAARNARLGSVEVGGEILSVRTPDGDYLPDRARAALEGVVVDSTRGEPLGGAEVHLRGTDHVATTDRIGRYRLEVPLDGTYLATFRHPRLDSLGIESIPDHQVALVRGSTAELDLGVPSERTLAALQCGREPGVGPEAILWGHVIESELGGPLAGATVRLVPEGGEPDAADAPGAILETRTDMDGRYKFCSVPPEVRYQAETELFGVSGTARGIRLAEGAVVPMELTLRIGSVGEIRGVVRQGESGPAIGNATILVAGDGVARTVQSDGAGRFVIEEIRSGRYDLQVSHLGYREVTTEVEVAGGGRTTNVTVQLLRDAVALDPITVEVEARPSWGPLAEVYDRRDYMERLGVGRFFDRTAIEREAGSQVTRMVARMAGARIQPASRMGSQTNLLHIHRTNSCHPAFFLDGVPYRLEGQTLGIDPNEQITESIDDVVSLGIVEMIEVYRSSAQLPMEFATDRAAHCGVIAVWTRRGHR